MGGHSRISRTTSASPRETDPRRPAWIPFSSNISDRRLRTDLCRPFLPFRAWAVSARRERKTTSVADPLFDNSPTICATSAEAIPSSGAGAGPALGGRGRGLTFVAPWGGPTHSAGAPARSRRARPGVGPVRCLPLPYRVAGDGGSPSCDIPALATFKVNRIVYFPGVPFIPAPRQLQSNPVKVLCSAK